MAKLAFNTEDHAPENTSFEPIPEGWYTAKIVESQIKKSRFDNDYLELQFEIIGPSYAGRKVFTNLNIGHQTDTVKEIAYKQLYSICHAIDVKKISDSEELHNKPLGIRLRITAPTLNSDGVEIYGAKNEIKGYRKVQREKKDSFFNKQMPKSVPSGAGNGASVIKDW